MAVEERRETGREAGAVNSAPPEYFGWRVPVIGSRVRLTTGAGCYWKRYANKGATVVGYGRRGRSGDFLRVRFDGLRRAFTMARAWFEESR